MSIQSNFPNLQPSLLLDFANTKQLDNRVTFTRSTPAVYYDGKTTAMAEQNLLLDSQTFTSWSKVSLSATNNATTAPDGTATATLLTLNSANAEHYVSCVTPLTDTVIYTYSVYAKPNGSNWIVLNHNNTTAATFVYFNVSTGTVGTTGAGITASIVNAGNGWYRCIYTIKHITASHGTNGVQLYIANSTGTSTVFTGDGTSGVYIWGAQLEQRSAVSAYTPTTTQPITNYIPVLLSAGGNQPRFDCNPTTGESLGLLIEEQRTNTALQSQDFTQWTQFQNGVTTSNQMIAPDGTLTADQMVMTTDTFSGVYLATTAPSAGTYTISLWARTVSGTQTFNMGFYSASTAFFPTAFTATNTWQRFTYTVTLPSSGNFHIGNFNASAGTVFIWGAQCEAGAFATSYIATTSASATRTADTADMTGTNFSSWWNQNEGTFYIENSYGSFSNQPIALSDPNVGNAWAYATMAGALSTYFPAPVSLNMTSNVTASVNTNYRYASAYSPTGKAVSASNTTAVTSANTISISPVTSLSMGRYTNLYFINGRIKKIAYYPIAVTSTQLQALTS